MILIIGEDPSIFGMDLKFIFPVTLVELHIKLRNTIINFLLTAKPGYLVGSEAKIIQGNLLCLFFGQQDRTSGNRRNCFRSGSRSISNCFSHTVSAAALTVRW